MSSAPPVRPTGVRVWWLGARPRTLGAGVMPVLVGTAAAGHAIPWRFVAALVVGLGLQVGVNYANDYFDAARGVDTAERLGPPRLAASGLARPGAVARAALASFGVAAGAGVALAVATNPALLLPLGAAALAAAVLYSGGPRPYAGMALGEVAVFVFFGLVATAGSAYVQLERVPKAAWWASVPVGLLAVAILVANNLRDIPTDSRAGKRTLPVRLGERRTRVLYRSLLGLSFLATIVGVAVDGLPVWALSSLASLPLGARPLNAIGAATGRQLVPVLVRTAALHVAFSGLLALGLWLA